MKIDFSQTFKTLDGKDFPGEQGVTITLKSICQNALLAQYPQEQVEGAEKARRWLLATLLQNGEVTIEPDEAVLLKKVIGLGYGPLVVGQAYAMLKG